VAFSSCVSSKGGVILGDDLEGKVQETAVFNFNLFLSQHLFGLPNITEIPFYINRSAGTHVEVQTRITRVRITTQRRPTKFIDFSGVDVTVRTLHLLKPQVTR
jgi:hypothetical protein